MFEGMTAFYGAPDHGCTLVESVWNTCADCRARNMEVQESGRASHGMASAAGGAMACDGLARNRDERAVCCEICPEPVYTRASRDEVGRSDGLGCGCVIEQADRLPNQNEREQPSSQKEPHALEIGKGQKRRENPDRGSTRTRRRRKRRLRYEASCPPSRNGSSSGTASQGEALPPLRYTASVEPERMC